MKQNRLLLGGLFSALLISSLLTSCLRDPSDDLPDLYETLQADSRFGIFTRALEKAGLVEEITKYNFTFFVPPDEIFTSFLETKGYSNLDSMPLRELGQLVRYHIQQGKSDESILVPNYYLTPNFSAPDSNYVVILLEVTSSGLRLNGSVNVIQSDIEAKNGFIHVIDQVMVPPSMMDILEDNSNFSIFREAVERTGLKNLVQAGSPYTMFVPANGIFETYFEQVDGITNLSDMTDEQLKPIVRYHICPKNLRSEDFQDAIIFDYYPTLSAGDTLRIGGDLAILINDSVSFLLSDVQATNGVIHFISDVLDPK